MSPKAGTNCVLLPKGMWMSDPVEMALIQTPGWCRKAGILQMGPKTSWQAHSGNCTPSSSKECMGTPLSCYTIWMGAAVLQTP